jgi:hypothetical protein
MREIKKVELGNIQNVDLKTNKNEKAEAQPCAEVGETTINDFSNPKAEVLGRSQVTEADNLKSDMTFGLENPQALAGSDKLFDTYYEQLLKENDPAAYEKACAMATSEEARDVLVQ